MRRMLHAALAVLSAALFACGGSAEPPAPARPAASVVACPVCGGAVESARAVVETVEGAERTCCSNGCAIRLRTSPEKFAGK